MVHVDQLHEELARAERHRDGCEAAPAHRRLDARLADAREQMSVALLSLTVIISTAIGWQAEFITCTVGDTIRVRGVDEAAPN